MTDPSLGGPSNRLQNVQLPTVQTTITITTFLGVPFDPQQSGHGSWSGYATNQWQQSSSGSSSSGQQPLTGTSDSKGNHGFHQKKK